MKTKLFESAIPALAVVFLMIPALPAEGKDEKPAVPPGTVTPGTVTATAEGREIQAVSPGAVSINTSGAAATVNLGKHVLKVGKDHLQLDEQMPSNIPAETKKVEINVAEEMLTVKADGKEVLRAKLEDQ